MKRVAIIALGLVLTCLVAFYYGKSKLNDYADHFSKEVQQDILNVQAMLKDIAGKIEKAPDNVKNIMQVEGKYPKVEQLVAADVLWQRYLKKDQREAFVKEMKEALTRDFDIMQFSREMKLIPEQNKDAYLVLVIQKAKNIEVAQFVGLNSLGRPFFSEQFALLLQSKTGILTPRITIFSLSKQRVLGLAVWEPVYLMSTDKEPYGVVGSNILTQQLLVQAANTNPQPFPVAIYMFDEKNDKYPDSEFLGAISGDLTPVSSTPTSPEHVSTGVASAKKVVEIGPRKIYLYFVSSVYAVVSCCSFLLIAGAILSVIIAEGIVRFYKK